MLLPVHHHDVVAGKFSIANSANGQTRSGTVGPFVPTQAGSAEVNLFARVAGKPSFELLLLLRYTGAHSQMLAERFGPEEAATTAGTYVFRFCVVEARKRTDF